MTDADGKSTIGLIGKKLGRYLVQAELGRGGMATVYRARDPQLGRDVALKVMHTFFTGRPELDARFAREAKAVAAIRHPSILAVFDSAPPAGEEPGYIVSEIIDGPSLRKLAEPRGGRLLPEAATLVAIPVAEALAAAHAAGIVHRDVKPDNVLLDRAGGGVRVVLTDFGVAHVSGMETMTATGAVLGSPAYMSPEQARGDDVGPQSDLFSLGVMLYQLATGRLPFAGKDTLAVVMAVLRGDCLRPTQVEPRVGPELERVIMRCLAPKPADRFAAGRELAAALRATLADAELGDEAAALRRYVDDGDGFEREVGPRIVRVALAAAERAQRKGAVPRALAEIGRALAYEPDCAEAKELLARVGRGQRWRWFWRRAAVVAAAGGGVAALVAFVAGRPHAPPPPPPPIAAPAPAAAPAAIPAQAPARVGDAVVTPAKVEAPTAIATPIPTAPEIPVRTTRHPARTDGSKARPTAAARAARAATGGNMVNSEHPAPAGAAAPTVSTTSTAASPAVAPPPPPAAAAPPSAPVTPAAPAHASTASLIVRASHGFCEPSVDDRPPSLRAEYKGISPGPHEIYCTMPQGGPKVRVGRYDVQPGTSPSLVIVPDPDGHPTLRRPD